MGDYGRGLLVIFLAVVTVGIVLGVALTKGCDYVLDRVNVRVELKEVQ